MTLNYLKKGSLYILMTSKNKNLQSTNMNKKDISTLMTKFKVYDQYYTPKIAWEKIAHLIPTDSIIWEAFLLNSKKSKSIQYLKELNFKVVGNTKWNFLKKSKDKVFRKKYNLIVSNPPFETNIKIKILKRLVKNNKPFIIIMNSMNIHSNYFNDIFKEKRKHLQIIYPRGKLHFERLDEKTKQTELKKNTSFYCIYVAYKMKLKTKDLYLD